MEAKAAIFERRTIHLFEPKKVEEKIVEEAIMAANQAPCHRLTFPWRFYSVGSNKRNQILNLAIEIKHQYKKKEENSINILRTKYQNPSHLLVAGQLLNKDELIQKEDYAACSCAIQNLSISLASNGVNSKWSTGSITRNPKIYQITEIDMRYEEIIGFIWVGYGEKLKEIIRPKLNDIYKII